MRFKDPQVSAPEIGSRLGVNALVEGSVTREGNRIRVTAQLIRATSDEHFGSETYDREFKDALSLESELAQAIAAARKALELDPNLTDAHVLLANSLQEQWNWREAEAEYHRALDLSPNDASAHWGLALWLVCQGRTDEAIS
jgi:Flp pilus assembly protein TadD